MVFVDFLGGFFFCFFFLWAQGLNNPQHPLILVASSPLILVASNSLILVPSNPLILVASALCGKKKSLDYCRHFVQGLTFPG